jgi:hypothetical protein
MATKSIAKSKGKKTSRPPKADSGTSFNLQLDRSSAPDDGKTAITATATYILNGEYAAGQDVTFELQDAPNAKFTDNGKQQTHGQADAFGTVAKSFTDTQPESGSVYAYVTSNQILNDTKTFKFTAATNDDWVLKLDLQNNGALDDGKDAITAVATLTNGGVPQKDLPIDFLIESGLAVFSNNTQKITVNTLADGTASAPFTDTASETGFVSGTYQLKEGDNPSQTKQYYFYEPSNFTIDLSLSNNGVGQAGGTDRITATATLTAQTQGAIVANKPIQFQFAGETDAQFIDPKTGDTTTENPITVNTNGNGVSTVDFVDDEWQSGKLDAFLKVSADDLILADKDYTFTSPSDLAVSLTLTTRTTDGKNLLVQFDEAPADGQAELTVTAAVTTGGNTKTPWTYGGNLQLTLTDSSGGNNTHATFTTNGQTSIIVPIGTDGVATASFADGYVEQGNVNAQVLVPTNDGPKASEQFTFMDPWTAVTALKGLFANGQLSNLIYGNGRSQAGLTLTMTLASYNNIQLGDNNSPPIDAVISATQLIEYMTKNQLTDPWSYSTTSNGYLGVPDYSEDDSFQRGEDDGNGVSNGVATITYYITSSSQKGSTPIGAKIQPTGQLIYATAQMGNDGKTPKGGLQAANPVYFATGTKDYQAPAIVAVAAIPYGDVDLKIIGSAIGHGTTDDTRPIVSEDNFWRQWNYTIMIDQTRSNRKNCTIKNCLLDPSASLTSDYAFAEQSNVIYDFKAYFWPNNVSDSDGNPLASSGSYDLKSQGAGPYGITVNPPAGQLMATLFCAFGNVSVGAYSFTSVGITIIDQFGNSGRFVLNTDTGQFPQTYDTKNILPNWKVVTARAEGTPSPSSNAGSYNGVKYVCQDTGNGSNNVHPWNGPDLSEKSGGTPVQLDTAGATGYTTTPIDTNKGNYQKTYNIAQSSGTYWMLGNSGQQYTGRSGDSWVIVGSNAQSWGFAPIWQNTTLIVSYNITASSPPCCFKVWQTVNSSSYYVMLTDPISTIGIDPTYVWKLTS